MTDLTDYQAFTPIADGNGLPSLEWMLWLGNLATVIAERDAQIAALSPLAGASGWAVYNDTAGAQSLTAGGTATFTVNAGSKIETYAPDGIALWSGNKITGREGDAIVVKVQCVFTPSDAVASTLDFSVDIGGAIGEVEYQNFPVTKGAGMPHKVSWTFLAYTLDTWEANGGTVRVVSDGAGQLTSKRVLISRVHKA